MAIDEQREKVGTPESQQHVLFLKIIYSIVQLHKFTWVT